MTAPSRQTRFRVEGMDCAGCARKVETAARRSAGVEDVSVSVTAATMTVTHADHADLEAIARTLTNLGYRSEPILRERTDKQEAECHGEGCGCSHGHDRAHDHHHDHEHEHHGHAHHAHSHEEPDEASASPPDRAALARHSHAHSHAHDHSHAAGAGPWWRSPKGRLTLASGAAVALAYVVGHIVPALAAPAFLAAILVGLLPIAWRALVAARYGSPFTIEMLMTIAASGAVVIGATEEAAVVVFLFLVGEMLEGVAAARARNSIAGLADLVPKIARRERDGRVEEIAADQLAIGDVILVRPGDRISADGVVSEGTSSVDEAPVTGESVPKVKADGDTVFAGTVNGDGLLRIRVTATAADNTIARVIRLVEEAQESKAPTERFIDRFAVWYTPAVVVVGAAVAVLPPLATGADWSEWVYKGLAILLIGCPCALVISTPAAIAAGLSAGARRGLLMKGGAVLEQLGSLTAIAFDKTGTLTAGKPVVTDVEAFRGAGADDVLALAAALETGSSHPLAQAILSEAAGRGLRPSSAVAVSAVPGQGVAGTIGGAAIFLGSAEAATSRAGIPEAETAAIARRTGEGKSVSVLLRDGAPLGLIALRDEARPDAGQAIAALKAAGMRPLMLTGDNRRTAEAIAAPLGIEAHAELLPEDKQTLVRRLQAEGHKVGKVGDGINDAPALAAAEVGIAMGGGTDVALETADAAVLHGRVMDVADMVRLSRSVMGNIRQNIAIALGLKGVFLVTTLIGVTGLWPAILADTGATVLVTANAMRLLGWKGTA